ncbi:MAG: type II secretion system protein [Phycisphaerales bacterium]
MHTRTGARGFTILELVVLIALFLVMAATVAPRFAAAGDRALRDAMAEQVRMLNEQVDAYRRDNAGVAPALDGPGATGWAALIQGGYLSQAPVNAYVGQSGVSGVIASPGILLPEETLNSTDIGWFYHPLRGEVVANGFDHIRLLFHNEDGYDPKSFAW